MVFLAIFAIFIGSYLSAALNWGRLLLGMNGLEVRLLNEGGSYWSAAVISVFTVRFKTLEPPKYERRGSDNFLDLFRSKLQFENVWNQV